MWSLLTVFLGLSVLWGLPQDAIGSCQLKTTPTAPLIVTTFGSKQLVSNSAGNHERDRGETIELFCGSGFLFNYRHSYGHTESLSINDNKVSLRCESDYFVYPKNRDRLMNLVVQCQKGVSQLFESRTSLPNCEGDMTLVLGHDFEEMGTMKNAALCYNIVASRMKYIAYTTFPEKNLILQKTQLGQLNTIGLDIKVNYRKNLIKSISQTEIDAYLKKKDVLWQLFQGRVFESASLVLDDAVGVQLAGYEAMMATTWLSSLRSGNWKHWVAAMREATKAGLHFDVRLGVSGVLELPLDVGRSCNASRSLVFELADGSSLPAPAHIWAHVHILESTGGVEDEFVIIGHNSPFFRSDNSTELCSSMCDQVSWLKNSLFASLHRFPAYGLVQCCRVEDVASKLDNFPGSFANESASRSTTPAPDPIPAFVMSLKPESENTELE
ncbi:uncharacterized protein LOC108048906 [Drosophila rhopaloa]|uniref:Uncharacterized protein LOC108048906 n=1 Tax=Drosophila rhopaloa TaxID=1041015 RepID=A0A6P4F4K2_DRORH|nr:uncharacterized protein LOC108048906 [Drosophila rhopaloa]